MGPSPLQKDTPISRPCCSTHTRRRLLDGILEQRGALNYAGRQGRPLGDVIRRRSQRCELGCSRIPHREPAAHIQNPRRTRIPNPSPRRPKLGLESRIWNSPNGDRDPSPGCTKPESRTASPTKPAAKDKKPGRSSSLLAQFKAVPHVPQSDSP